MKKENLLSKWLDHNLTDTEQEAFEKTDAFRSYQQVDRLAQYFKAPEFDTASQYTTLKEQLALRDNTSSWKQYAYRIAAVFVIAFGLYWALNQSTNTTFTAHHAEQTNVDLPDASEVILNAGSELSYDKDDWTDDKRVFLNGEAFFSVAKGKEFSVETNHGTVQVLGTQFNVKSRADWFEVTCFEGKVAVTLGDNEYMLTAGRTLRWSAAKDAVENELTALIKPSWLQHKSVFKSVPLHEVLKELERQYDVEIETENINTSVIYTGSFTHKNLPTALQAITIPLTLSYQINDKTVVLKNE